MSGRLSTCALIVATLWIEIFGPTLFYLGHFFEIVGILSYAKKKKAKQLPENCQIIIKFSEI